MTDQEAGQSPLLVFDCVKALAFIGDLSMGQPTDHSPRTAWLASRLASAAGLAIANADVVREAALLRWSGCTANASGFAQVFGDDVAFRQAMLEDHPDWAEPLEALGDAGAALTPLAVTHCEVAGEVARMLGLARATETALRHIFETWDGRGLPSHLTHEAVPVPVSIVSLAGDLEIYSRVYGVDGALAKIAKRADMRYPAVLVGYAKRHAVHWLKELNCLTPAEVDAVLSTAHMRQTTSPELIADVIDLKLPWMTGFSRAVASTALAACARLTSSDESRARVYHAGLIHGIGRASVPNAVWNQPERLSESAWEKVRLVPYWTSRAGRLAGAIGEAAEVASYAYERLDGSGYFRGVRDQALGLEARVLAASVAWVALRSLRPWRAALSPNEAAQRMLDEVAKGRFDANAVDALLTDADAPVRRQVSDAPSRALLSVREIDVLKAISRGASNKEAARELVLSPSTVRTHVENIFRKLECSTRAAATLKASAMGWL
ncbi:HD domain-containing phosphohydrolase [Caballeronia sp. GAFFF2]|jgi:HD-GYP domain-containing protein (c-di-GMP phosphodiesterase class II)/DNA-binding CsgD family transcriptional regulator|uniref:HD domain-containing phosphohydrolase n=1 Tax=Caballeronia sp. GAFFF2 TaxID=2921741 RepID=UPI0020282718|nr:HD domain-containing phosphohydrolase [Caballeronia sp. GAFFF2]